MMAFTTGVITTTLAGGTLFAASPAFAAGVTCSTHKARTAGWIDCKGSGTVRIRIDCAFPQAGDYVGPYTILRGGAVTLRGECRNGINKVTYQVK